MKALRQLPVIILLSIIIRTPEFCRSQPPTYVWAKTLIGNVESIQRATAVDASGNVYLYGVFFGTVDFDPGPATVNITPVPYGCNVYLAKYDIDGNYMWVKNIAISASYGGSSMVMDANGDILITGFYSGTNVDFDPGPGIATKSSLSGSTDVFIAKYDANGNYLWAISLGSTADDRGNDLLSDAAGNIFATGTFNGIADFDPGTGSANLTALGAGDIFLAKYDGNGNYLWAKQAGGPATDDVRDIALDALGNIILTGTFWGTSDFDPDAGVANLIAAGQNDSYLAKYDANGSYLWSKQFGSTSYDIGTSLKTDVTGNLFITGTFNGTVDFDPGTGITNLTAPAGGGSYFGYYDASGSLLWVKFLPLNTGNIDITIDQCNNLLIAGSYLSGGPAVIDMDPGPATANLSVPGNLPPPYYNIFGEYDITGNYLWAGVFGHTCYCSVAGYKSSITCDTFGNVYYTGIMNGSAFGSSTVDFDPGTGIANLTAPNSVDNVFFAKYICPQLVLPITLLAFTGENRNHINYLQWSTASEKQNDHFDIERGSGELFFEPLSSINGNGNSAEIVYYSFEDHKPMAGLNYYRLKQVDEDGSIAYSDVIAVNNPTVQSSPVANSYSNGVIVISGLTHPPLYVSVFDAAGRCFYSSNQLQLLSEYSIQLNVSQLPAGIYFITVRTSHGNENILVPLNK